jgi:FMN phosphatase YigB (HAD superfamily)
MATAVVSFDLDGVVMRGPFVSAVQPRVWAHLGQSAGLNHLDAEARDAEVWRAVRQEHDRRLGAQDFVGAWDWQGIYEDVSRGLGGDAMPDVATIVRESCEVAEHIGLLPGAAAGLQQLATAGVRLVAITNGYHAFQWPVLEKLGLAELFDAVVTPDIAGFAKPDPRMFRVVPGLVAHVGDLLVHDVFGANQAGLRSVWLDADLPTAFQACPPHERPSMAGFEAYLQETLERSRYRQFHPEATLEACRPGAVARDVDEAATALLEAIAR